MHLPPTSPSVTCHPVLSLSASHPLLRPVGPDGELPEELAKCEPRLIEQVCNEVIDSGGAVHWDDIAGLETAKHLIKEIVVWPMQNPHLFTVSSSGLVAAWQLDSLVSTRGTHLHCRLYRHESTKPSRDYMNAHPWQTEVSKALFPAQPLDGLDVTVFALVLPCPCRTLSGPACTAQGHPAVWPSRYWQDADWQGRCQQH